MSETTKKLLVAFDPKKPTKKSSDFLVPLVSEGRVHLWGTRSKKAQDYGLAIFTGRGVAPPDLFARLVDGGAVIESVDDQMAAIQAYISELKATRVGSVYQVTVAESGVPGFELEKTALKATEKKRRLP